MKKDYDERIAKANQRLAEANDYSIHCRKKLQEKRAKNTPPPEGQKFTVGTKVHIAKDLGKSMAHFTADCDALIEYSYAEMYGGNDVKSYSVMLLDKRGNERHSTAWYKEHQLTEI